jgi:hypothetical protein
MIAIISAHLMRGFRLMSICLIKIDLITIKKAESILGSVPIEDSAIFLKKAMVKSAIDLLDRQLIYLTTAVVTVCTRL